MHRRGLIAAASSLVFLAASALGLHFHVAGDLYRSQSDSGSFVFADLLDLDSGDGVYVTSEFSLTHAAKHFIDGDVDVDAPIPIVDDAMPSTSAPVLTWDWLGVLALRPKRPSAVRFIEPPLRPPRRIHFLPPANAPPFAALNR